MGSVTQKGLGRLYTLGANLRNRYYKLLPSNGFYAADKLRVDSSPYERCLMSTQSILSALLPPPATGNGLPISWQPVAVNALSMDNIVRTFIHLQSELPKINVKLFQIFFPTSNCPKYKVIYDKLHYNPDPSTALYKYYKDNAELFAYLSARTGEVSIFFSFFPIKSLLNFVYEFYFKT